MIYIATKNDIKYMNIINKICLPENYKIEDWEKIVEYGNSLIYKVENNIVGYILVNQSGYIVSFAVLPKHRCKKIGTNLIKFSIKNILQLLSCIRLSVRTSNKQAISLYEKCGFKIDKIIKNGYGDENEIQMIYKKE